VIAKTNFFSYSLIVFVFAIIGANFSEARVRRNSSPQPPPSAAPERSGQEFFSKWVRAKFRISHQMAAKKLRRSSTNKVVSGILGGIGEYMNIDPVVVRIVFLAIAIFTGFVPGLLFYLLAHLVVPEISREETKPS